MSHIFRLNVYEQLEGKWFNIINQQLGCCGANGPNDWTSSKFNANAPGLNVQVTSPSRVFTIPASCCKPNITVAACDKARKIDVGVTRVPETAELYSKASQILQTIYIPFDYVRIFIDCMDSSFTLSQGCTDKLVQAVDDNLINIILVIAGIVAIEIFALIISICLCCNINSKEDHYKS